MKRMRSLIAVLVLSLCSAVAYADSPITSPQIRTSIDTWLGSAYRGERYDRQQVEQIGQKLLKKVGQKQTSIGKVFDAVQSFHGAAFAIRDEAQRQKAVQKFSRGLAKMWQNGDGGANAAAAHAMNDVYSTLFYGSDAQARRIEKSAGYKRLRKLQGATRNPALDVFLGMAKHYKDAFGVGNWDGTTKTSRQAVRSFSLAASKIVSAGHQASSHARQLLKHALQYSEYYDGVYRQGAQQVSRVLKSRAPKAQRLQRLRALRRGPLKVGR